jgi:ABC-type lipoprotein release transport system permease subunit
MTSKVQKSGSLALDVLIKLAWRNLWRNHRRTVIMLLAISLAVWAMIFMIALMRGMVDEMVKNSITNLPGHIQLHHPLYLDDPSIENRLDPPNKEFSARLEDPQVLGWSSRIRVPAMISSERDSRGVILLGVSPEGELALGFDKNDIVEGRFLQSDSDTGLVLGRKLMERLETDLGKRVVLMSQDPDNNVADRGFRIVGVYRAKLESLEEMFVYASRETTQKLLNVGQQVSEIAILGHDYRDISGLETLVRSSAPADWDIKTWQQLDPMQATMLKVMDGFVLVWIIVIYLAMSFGLVNTLMMAVFERVREIGLMMALGMRPALIVYQVLIESMMLLGLGLLTGTALAIATILPLQGGIDISMVAKGMEMMGAASVLYPALKWPDVLMANAVVIVLGLITSFLPAWRASRYRPVEAIAKS